MKRQVYMGGGIMNAVPREQYGLGSIFKGAKKAVKKVTGGIKDIALLQILRKTDLLPSEYIENRQGHLLVNLSQSVVLLSVIFFSIIV